MNYKEKYHKYLKSETWINIKLDLIEIRGQKCERCEKKTKYLHLHHLTYERVFKEEPGDLELLCGGCHATEHRIVKPPKAKSISLQKKQRVIIKALRKQLTDKKLTCEQYAQKVLWIRQGA